MSRLIDQVLSDLSKVMMVVRENMEEHLSADRVPEVGIRYISENSKALGLLVDAVYSEFNQEKRLVLEKEHRELNVHAAGDGFRELAAGVIDQAVRWSQTSPDLRGLHHLKDDDLEVLLRVLKYAKYSNAGCANFDLRYSPIEQYGLKRAAGNFEKPSLEEVKSVPWNLAEVVYGDSKTKILDQCLELGFDLRNPRKAFSSQDWDRDLARCISLLIDLLKCRAECGIAAVLIKDLSLERFLNNIVRAVDSEGIALLSRLRDVLSESGPAVEYHVRPFRSARKELLTQIEFMQPSLEIYRTVSELDKQNRKEQIVTNIDGDNYQIGQAGVVGKGTQVHGGTFNLNQFGSDIDLAKLGEELSRLRGELQRRSGGAATVEQIAEIGQVASAEIEAKRGNASGVMGFLKRAGDWTLKAATDIGSKLAVDVIKKSAGI